MVRFIVFVVLALAGPSARAEVFSELQIKDYLRSLSGGSLDPLFACYLEQHMGESVKELDQVGGLYHSEVPGWSAAHMRACPQPGCANATVALKTSGELAILLESEKGQTRAFSNTDLPAPMQAKNVRRVDRKKAIASCWAPAVIAQSHAFHRAVGGLSCDAEHSKFSETQFVNAKSAKAHLHTKPYDFSKKSGYLIPGDLVQVSRLVNNKMSCVSYRTVKGKTVVGWVASDSLADYDLRLFRSTEGKAIVELANQFAAELPPTDAKYQQLQSPSGKLTVHELSANKVVLSMDLHIAGHICGLEKASFKRIGRRNAVIVPQAESDCGVIITLFNNGIVAEGNGNCGGARATCSGVFLTP